MSGMLFINQINSKTSQVNIINPSDTLLLFGLYNKQLLYLSKFDNKPIMVNLPLNFSSDFPLEKVTFKDGHFRLDGKAILNKNGVLGFEGDEVKLEFGVITGNNNTPPQGYPFKFENANFRSFVTKSDQFLFNPSDKLIIPHMSYFIVSENITGKTEDDILAIVYNTISHQSDKIGFIEDSTKIQSDTNKTTWLDYGKDVSNKFLFKICPTGKSCIGDPKYPGLDENCLNDKSKCVITGGYIKYNDDKSSPSSSSLSAGAIVLIVISSLIVIVLISGLIYVIYRRKQIKKRNNALTKIKEHSSEKTDTTYNSEEFDKDITELFEKHNKGKYDVSEIKEILENSKKPQEDDETFTDLYVDKSKEDEILNEIGIAYQEPSQESEIIQDIEMDQDIETSQSTGSLSSDVKTSIEKELLNKELEKNAKISQENERLIRENELLQEKELLNRELENVKLAQEKGRLLRETEVLNTELQSVKIPQGEILPQERNRLDSKKTSNIEEDRIKLNSKKIEVDKKIKIKSNYLLNSLRSYRLKNNNGKPDMEAEKIKFKRELDNIAKLQKYKAETQQGIDELEKLNK